MALASLQNIEKSFGDRVLFQGVDFLIDKGERVGLIGANGSGKSTLFKILSGAMTAEIGVVSVSRGTKIGYLVQDPTFEAGNSVVDEAELAFGDLHDLAHRLRDLEHEMAHLQGDDLDKVLRKYEGAQHEFDLAGGYAWQHKLEATLLGVGLGRESWEQDVATLSGGQRSRLALAKLLVAAPDLLLLDEPTNHLDLAAIAWLEDFLLGFSGAVWLISHDRYLLDRLATRIVWLNGQKLASFPGNYSAFVQQRELLELTQQRAHAQQQADIAKQEEYIRRFSAGQRARQAMGRRKRLDRLLRSDAVVQEVGSARGISLRIETDQRAGDRVLRVHELSKSYGPSVLWNGVTFDVTRGERIGIIGPNGSGKTTLLRALIGEETADGGDVRWGANLAIGYYDQRLDDFDPENTVLEEVADGRALKEKQLRDVLGALLFRGDDVHKPMAMLSGGERARVALAELLLDEPNVLLLDEPTNHLDVSSCEALEGALGTFPGTVLCVSHDRYFLEKLAGRMLVIEPPTIVDFAGTFSQWVARKAQPTEPEKPPARRANPPKAAKPARAAQNGPGAKAKRDNPYLRPFGRLTLQDLERQIQETEAAVVACQGRFAEQDVARDAAAVRRVQAEHEALAAKLKTLEAEYFGRQQ